MKLINKSILTNMKNLLINFILIKIILYLFFFKKTQKIKFLKNYFIFLNNIKN